MCYNKNVKQIENHYLEIHNVIKNLSINWRMIL